MGWEQARLAYKGCQVFRDGYGGRKTHERNKDGKVVLCCYGAYEGDPDWPEYCKECTKCPRFIRNVTGD